MSNNKPARKLDFWEDRAPLLGFGLTALLLCWLIRQVSYEVTATYTNYGGLVGFSRLVSSVGFILALLLIFHATLGRPKPYHKLLPLISGVLTSVAGLVIGVTYCNRKRQLDSDYHMLLNIWAATAIAGGVLLAFCLAYYLKNEHHYHRRR